MSQRPQPIEDTWGRRKGPAVFATVGENGVPNAIYVTCLALYDDRTLVIADNYFDKTRANILGGTRGSLLYITEDSKTIQIKGSVTYNTSGPMFDHMKSWNPSKHPGHAAAALAIEEIYSGAQRLL